MAEWQCRFLELVAKMYKSRGCSIALHVFASISLFMNYDSTISLMIFPPLLFDYEHIVQEASLQEQFT